MKNTLFVAFKGKNNSSAILLDSLSGEHCLLTNSYAGLKHDIDGLGREYDEVYLFGAAKELTDSFRIEETAEKDGKKLTSKLDLDKIGKRLSEAGIKSRISERATHYLCNEAYWYLLEKYKGRAVLIHIPTIKHIYDIIALRHEETGWIS